MSASSEREERQDFPGSWLRFLHWGLVLVCNFITVFIYLRNLEMMNLDPLDLGSTFTMLSVCSLIRF